jgi:hypothetical protein
LTIHHSPLTPVKKHIALFILAAFVILSFTNAGCKVYKFNDAAIPDTMHSIKVNFIENRAPYVNPQLSPALTDRLKRKISSQTRLSVTNSDGADYDVKATITDYSVSTTGISDKKSSMNRLTVTVHVALTDQKGGKAAAEYDVVWNKDFEATLTLQAAEASLFDVIVRSLADDIFNRMFSNW